MRLVLPSSSEAMPQAVRFAESAAKQAGFPVEVLDRMLLAVGEAVANSLEHGNGSLPDRQLTLGWSTEDKGGWISLDDEGSRLTLDQMKGAALPSDLLQTGGRGLFIIKELSDDVKVEEDGRRLLLWFEPRSNEPT